MINIENVVPKLREGVRLKSTSSEYILSASNAFVSLNLDAVAIVSKMDGIKSINDICKEILAEKPKLRNIENLYNVVQQCISKIWQQGVFLQTDNDTLMSIYSYCEDNCFYSPYFCSDLNLEPIYLSPVLEKKFFSNITTFKTIFGSVGLYVTLLDRNSKAKSQYCFLKTQAKDILFLYAIYGNKPTVSELKRVKHYLENTPLDDENHIIKSFQNRRSIKIIVYSLIKPKDNLLPCSFIEEGAIRNEVNNEDLIISSVDI